MRKKSIILLLAMCAVMLTGCDSLDYNKAMNLYEEGQYEEAKKMFEELGWYKDSGTMVNECEDARIEQIVEEEYNKNVGEEWLESIRECGLNDLTAEYTFNVYMGSAEDSHYGVNVELSSFSSANDINEYTEDELLDILGVFQEKYLSQKERSFLLELHDEGIAIDVYHKIFNGRIVEIGDGQGNRYEYVTYNDSGGLYLNDELVAGIDAKHFIANESNGSGDYESEWDKMTEKEKQEWLEDNYGDGKMDDINEAIEDYENK